MRTMTKLSGSGCGDDWSFSPPDGSVEHGHVDLDIDAETLERMASRASGDLPQGAALLNSGGLTGQYQSAGARRG